VASLRFNQLNTRISELKTLLPPSNPTGNYTPQEFDVVRAFQLLAHAEFEAYLEDVACTVVDTALKGWLADKRPRLALGHLILHVDFRHVSPTWYAKSEKDRIAAAKDRFINFALHSNHGIRERNVLALLLPLGLRLANIRPVWLATIDSFGGVRGQTAHTAKSVQTPPDRDSQEQIVDQILAGLKDLDVKLARLPAKRMLLGRFAWATEVSIEAAKIQST
jgi:hypothetical protein